VPNAPIVLILGDTPDARALAEAVADRGTRGIYAHAGRRSSKAPPPLPTRIGSFGGPEGLAQYLVEAGITHIVDATQPFAETMSESAVRAAEMTNLPLVAFGPAPWTAEPEDTWINAPDMATAVAALDTDPQRIFLAIGRKGVAQFASLPQHHYVLRLSTPPRSIPPLPHHDIVVERSAGDTASEVAFLQDHDIGLIVARNTGAPTGYPMLEAARALGLPVLMIVRPHLSARKNLHRISDVLTWLDQNGTKNVS